MPAPFHPGCRRPSTPDAGALPTPSPAAAAALLIMTLAAR